MGKVTFDHIKKLNKGDGEAWVSALNTATNKTKQKVSVIEVTLLYLSFQGLQLEVVDIGERSKGLGTFCLAINFD